MWDDPQRWIHNSSHRPPPYFEWWYFHFVTPEGVALNLVLHETDIFGQHTSPYLSLSLWRPDQPPCYLKRALPQGFIARSRRYLEAGREMLQEDARGVLLDIDFPEQGVFFKGQLVKFAPPLVFGDGALFADDATGRVGYWVVAAPHAAFTAQLHLDGTVLNLQGMAYQDHQWGTLPLQEIVADWTWGHFSNSQLAVVFFQVRTQRGQLIQRVGVTAAGDQFADIALESDFLSTLSHVTRPETFAGDLGITFFGQNLGLEFAVSPDTLMRQRSNEEQGNKTVSYSRWAASGTYRDACARHEVYGISEYIRVRPRTYGSLSQPEHRQHYLWDHNGD